MSAVLVLNVGYFDLIVFFPCVFSVSSTFVSFVVSLLSLQICLQQASGLHEIF